MADERQNGKTSEPEVLLAAIKSAGQEGKPAADTADAEQDLAKKAGIEFGTTVLGGVLLGLLLDYSFGLMPWCTLGFTLGGFAAGLVRVWRAVGK